MYEKELTRMKEQKTWSIPELERLLGTEEHTPRDKFIFELDSFYRIKVECSEPCFEIMRYIQENNIFHILPEYGKKAFYINGSASGNNVLLQDNNCYVIDDHNTAIGLEGTPATIYLRS